MVANKSARLRENAECAQGLSAAQYRFARIRCAPLDDGDRCTVYEVRPPRCRAHVSLLRMACERAFDGE